MNLHPPSSSDAGLQPQGGAAKRLQRFRLGLEMALWRHGLWPVLTLAAVGVATWLVAIEKPAVETQLTAAQAVAAGKPVSPQLLAGDEDGARWQAFRGVLPPRAASAEAVQRLVALTGQALAWRQAEFLHSDDAALGLTRLQISVPVTGSYPALRQALVRALQDMPALAVDQVLFQRQSSGDTELQARVRFSIWMAREAAPAVTVPGGRR